MESYNIKDKIPPISCVYSIGCIKTNNIYIGMTKNLRNRISTHFSNLRNAYHPNNSLREDFQKYKETTFIITILFESISIDILREKEKELIKSSEKDKNTKLCNGDVGSYLQAHNIWEKIIPKAKKPIHICPNCKIEIECDKITRKR